MKRERSFMLDLKALNFRPSLNQGRGGRKERYRRGVYKEGAGFI